MKSDVGRVGIVAKGRIRGAVGRSVGGIGVDIRDQEVPNDHIGLLSCFDRLRSRSEVTSLASKSCDGEAQHDAEEMMEMHG